MKKHEGKNNEKQIFALGEIKQLQMSISGREVSKVANKLALLTKAARMLALVTSGSIEDFEKNLIH